LRIDDCDIPERLGHLQVLDWDDGAGLDRLLAAIETGLARREAEVTADSAPASVPSLAARQEDPQQTARERFANFVKKNGGLLVLIASIATILAAMLQFVDSPAIQAFFRSPTPTSTFTATGTIIPTSTYTPSSTPTDTPSPSPDFSATASMTTQPSRTPTVGVTPSFTPTHAVTLPAITSADCVPKEARRWEAYVIEAIDADKIKVRIQGDIALIHYLGVEAPDKEAYFGIYSFYKNIEWVVDQWVTLVSDPELEESGDELLRYVFVDDLFVNYELIRQGFAYEQGDASSYACADSFEHAQRQAELSPAGLWKPTNTPWPSPAPGEPPCSCRGDTRNCDTFRTQGEAQDCFEYCQGLGYGDVHNLDTDGDNWACEN
jgi:endonuclease YncB( thermonuclease family)